MDGCPNPPDIVPIGPGPVLIGGPGQALAGNLLYDFKKVATQLRCLGHDDCEGHVCWFCTWLQTVWNIQDEYYEDVRVSFFRGSTSEECTDNRRDGYGNIMISGCEDGPRRLRARQRTPESPLEQDPGFGDWVDLSQADASGFGLRSGRRVKGFTFRASATILCECSRTDGEETQRTWTVRGTTANGRVTLR